VEDTALNQMMNIIFTLTFSHGDILKQENLPKLIVVLT